MHPALRKGPHFYKNNPFSHFFTKHPPFSIFYKTPRIFHFSTKHPIFHFFTTPPFHFLPTGLERVADGESGESFEWTERW